MRSPFWLCTLALTLAACGGGTDDEGDAQDSGASGPLATWTDAQRIQASGPATHVEMGDDGTSSYLLVGSTRLSDPGQAKSALAYIGTSGPQPAGQGTQWLSFEMRGHNYFATQGEHLPLALRFRQYSDPFTTGTPPQAVEGRMVFLGRDALRQWDCSRPDAVGVYFETRVSGRNTLADAVAAKCADDTLSLRDGQVYRVELRADAQRTAYRITAADSGALVSQGSTGVLDFPPLAFNAAFLAELADPARNGPYASYLQQQEGHTAFALAATFLRPGQPWTLQFMNIASGWTGEAVP
ncbi:MAG: hypothetical protein Q4F13_14370 [Pseudomonadota bacterium]|nr:hypothetical protein [Pseudomonadota bacterium]